jgi:excisionase family DNA binding protein
MEADKFLYSVNDAREALGGIGRTQLYKWIAAGRITVTKAGARTFIHRDELKHFADQLRAGDPKRAV